MKAENNKVVAVLYTLYEKNKEGRLLEETPKDEPFRFIFGTGAIIPRFEKALLGKSTGDKFAFAVRCKDAYGDVNPQMSKVEVNKSIFGLTDTEEMEAMFQIGHILPMVDQDGYQWDGKVVGVKKNTLIMDLNHEYAGLDLFFEGEIVEVRNATKEELEYGEDGEDTIEIA